jgi:hypothetical protein
MIPFRGSAEIAGRLELPVASRVLLVETPVELESMLIAAAAPGASVRSSEAKHVRSIKETFDLILLWQESRVGSRALFEAAVKRLEPEGRLWVVTAMKKVTGPRTPAIHRLEPGDLTKAFAKDGLVRDREARLSAWHEAHRFVRK